MHSIRPRPICRAHNTFSPSIALWQHFVAPNQHLPQRLLQFSFATEAAQSRDDDNVGSNQKDLAVESGLAHFRKIVPPNVAVRRIKTSYSDFVVNPKLHPNFRNQRGRTAQSDGQEDKKDTRPYGGGKGQDVEKLLTRAYTAYDSSQDYEGVVVQPVSSPPVRESQYPWIIRNGENIRTGEERLNLEIQKFHEYIRPSPAESVARKHVIEQVRQHVREFLPGYVLEVFGSERTGISFAKSDIDLRLVPKSIYSDTTRAMLPPTLNQRYKMRRDLRNLHQHLMRACKKSYLLPTLRWARYPLISLQHRTSGLDIQIVLSNDTSLSRQFMQRYTEEHPCLRQLYSVIKATLDVRGLSDVFRGGVGSYSLFMMIVASLKHYPCSRNDDATAALTNFLRFWHSFQTEAHGLSIEPPEFLAKTHPIMTGAAIGNIQEGKIAQLPPWMLNLRDPADETNDLGRKIVAWKHVQKTFASLARHMREDLKQNTRPSLLAQFVGPVYTLQKAHRKQLSAYGSSLSEAGKQCTPSETSREMAEGADATTDEQALSHLAELEAIAKSIRKGEVVKKESAKDAEALAKAKESAQDAEALAKAMEAAQQDGVEGVNSWLKDIEEASAHKETGEAFSNILGLNRKTNR